jgi:hypothetical protein
MIEWLSSFNVSETIGIAPDYLIAGGMVGAGILICLLYRSSLRYVGYALVVAGLVFGYGSFRDSIGGATLIQQIATWKQQVAILQRDLAAAKLAAGLKAAEADALAKQKQDSDDKISQWQDYTNSLSDSLRDCRRASADDDRRLCAIIGNKAAGCKSAK